MKRSNYSLILGRDSSHKIVYSLIYFKDHSDDVVTELQTENKYEMKMKLDLLGLRIKGYQFNPYGLYGQVWFK